MMGKVMQCGFLVMIFLASGTSALQCHSLNYIWSAVSKGHVGEAHTLPLDKIVNCSNVCMEAQLKLSVAESVLLATYRGCPDKEDKDGKGHVATDKSNPHFIVEYNESYCSSDRCNNKIRTDGDLKWNPGKNTAPEKSGSNHCYAAITSDSKWNPKRVTCRKGYDQCYSSQGSITAGSISSFKFIKTCSWPNFTVSQNLSFGPIKFNLLGSSCLGSYCNGPKPDESSDGKETDVTCWFSFFALCAISLGGALLY